MRKKLFYILPIVAALIATSISTTPLAAKKGSKSTADRGAVVSSSESEPQSYGTRILAAYFDYNTKTARGTDVDDYLIGRIKGVKGLVQQVWFNGVHTKCTVTATLAAKRDGGLRKLNDAVSITTELTNNGMQTGVYIHTNDTFGIGVSAPFNIIVYCW